MSNWLLLLIVLSCPMMMIFMMSGMRGHGDPTGQTHASDPALRRRPDDLRDSRLAELEREVAQLRASRDHAEHRL